MKITKLIKELEKKLEKYGDILCYANAPDHPFYNLLDKNHICVDTAAAILEDASYKSENNPKGFILHIGGFDET